MMDKENEFGFVKGKPFLIDSDAGKKFMESVKLSINKKHTEHMREKVEEDDEQE
jgi:hypothetical protein